MSAVHHKDGDNSITMSRTSRRRWMDRSAATTPSTSRSSRALRQKTRVFCGNSLQASTTVNIRITNGALCDCTLNGSSLDDAEIADSKLLDCELNGTKFTRLHMQDGSVCDHH